MVHIEVGMMYKVKDKFSETYTIIQWCKEQFGGDGEPKYYLNTDIVKDLRWWVRQGYLFFRDEKDYAWFILKWP